MPPDSVGAPRRAATSASPSTYTCTKDAHVGCRLGVAACHQRLPRHSSVSLRPSLRQRLVATPVALNIGTNADLLSAPGVPFNGPLVLQRRGLRVVWACAARPQRASSAVEPPQPAPALQDDVPLQREQQVAWHPSEAPSTSNGGSNATLPDGVGPCELASQNGYPLEEAQSAGTNSGLAVRPAETGDVDASPPLLTITASVEAADDNGARLVSELDDSAANTLASCSMDSIIEVKVPPPEANRPSASLLASVDDYGLPAFLTDPTIPLPTTPPLSTASTSQPSPYATTPDASSGPPPSCAPSPATAPVNAGFPLTVGDLAKLVSYGFDHDGALPPGTLPSRLAAALRTSPLGGIPASPEDCAARRAAFGANALPPTHQVTFLELVAEALEDFTVQALLASGVLSLTLATLVPGPTATVTETATAAAGAAAAGGGFSTEWVEGAAILATVAIVVVVNAATNFAKESKFRQLNSIKDDVRVRVVRGGQQQEVPGRELLAGDLVVVEAGDILPADGLLVQGGELRLDQSHLTGESEDVARAPAPDGCPVVLSGSKVLDGYGKMIVLAVGPNSQQGTISTMMMRGGASGPASASPAASALSADGEAEGSANEAEERRRRRRRRRAEHRRVPAATAAADAATAATEAVLSLASVSFGSMDGDQYAAGDAQPAGGGRKQPGGQPPAGSAAAAAAALAGSGKAAEATGDGEGEEGSGLRVETFLMQKLGVLAQRIGAFGVAAAVGVFVVNSLSYTMQLAAAAATDGGAGLPAGVDVLRSYLDLLITSVTILVVAVPEGLPLAVTLALAFSVQRMLADRNLVRHLSACETMGAATAICSDKTGTLTQNNMSVVRLWAAGRQYRLQDLPPTQQQAERRAAQKKQLSAAGSAARAAAAADAADVDGFRPLSRLVPLTPTPTRESAVGAAEGRAAAAAGVVNGHEDVAAADDGSAVVSPIVRQLLVQGLTVNSTACIRTNPQAPDAVDRSGSPTECALLELPYTQGWGWDWQWAWAGQGTASHVASHLRQGPQAATRPTRGSRGSESGSPGTSPATSAGSPGRSASEPGGGTTHGSPAAGPAGSGEYGAAQDVSRMLMQHYDKEMRGKPVAQSPQQRNGASVESGEIVQGPLVVGDGGEWARENAGEMRAAAAVPLSQGVERAGARDEASQRRTVTASGGQQPSATAAGAAGSYTLAAGDVLQLVPFSSQRKRMSVVVAAPTLLHVPAAADAGDGNAASSRASGSNLTDADERQLAAAGRASPSALAAAAAAAAAAEADANASTSSYSPPEQPLAARQKQLEGQALQGAADGDAAAAAARGLVPVRVLTKGAAELVVERCSWQLGPDGRSLLPLGAEGRQRLLESFTGKGDRALRLLALAYRDMLLPQSKLQSRPGAAGPGAAGANGAGGTPGAPKGAAAASAEAGGGVVGGATYYGRGDGGAGCLVTSLDADVLEKDLVLVAVLGLQDPLRPEVPHAVEQCNRAGIAVRMITGDNIRTAAAIASQCGILPPTADVDALVARGAAAAAEIAAAPAAAATQPYPGASQLASPASTASFDVTSQPASTATTTAVATGPQLLPARSVTESVAVQPAAVPAPDVPYLVLEGATFRQLVLRPQDGSLNRDAFQALWPRLRVLARCSPGDKYTLVTALRQLRSEGRMSEVVAVTGDGTNDAPALSAADVGFCMNRGTPIAREAADILLLDSSFSSIVSAVLWGRNVYASVTKFLQFQLTANVVAVATAVGGAVWLHASPLAAVQMLWVNLIIDSMASLALATEAPTEAMLDVPPSRPDDPLVTPTVLKHIAGQALFQLTVLYGMLLAAQHYSTAGGHDIAGVVQDPATAAATVDATLAMLFGGGGAAAAAPAANAAAAAAASSSSGIAGVLGSSGAALVDGIGGTLVFNTFVQMQVFNQLNCRRVRDERNVLEGISAQPLFLTIIAVEAVLQYFIVQYGGEAFNTVPLSGPQWAMCVGMGALGLVVRAGLSAVQLPSETAVSRAGAATGMVGQQGQGAGQGAATRELGDGGSRG